MMGDLRLRMRSVVVAADTPMAIINWALTAVSHSGPLTDEISDNEGKVRLLVAPIASGSIPARIQALVSYS